MPFRSSPSAASPLARGRLLRKFDLSGPPSTAFPHGGNNVIVSGVPEGQRMELVRMGWRWWALYDFPIADISIRARARVEGSPRLGLTVRRNAIETTQLGYVAYVQPSIRLARLEIFADASYRPLTPWTEVASLRDDGGVNDIELRVGGDLLVLLVNDEAVLSARDATYGTGVAGMELHGEPGDVAVVSEVELHRVE